MKLLIASGFLAIIGHNALPFMTHGSNSFRELTVAIEGHMPGNKRPLSPHLQVYRWELHMMLSILHRATGVALGVGTLLLAWWVMALAGGEKMYQTFQGFIQHPIGQIVLFGFSFALMLHALNGIRHLFWDIGQGFEKKQTKMSGLLVVSFTFIFTVAIWIYAYMLMGRF